METREQFAEVGSRSACDPRYLTQVVRFSSKFLYLMNHLTGATFVSEIVQAGLKFMNLLPQLPKY